MSIFRRKKNNIASDLVLAPAEETAAFDWIAVLCKAAFMVCALTGGIGSFLSAYAIKYNRGLFFLTILFFSFLLSAVYESGRRRLINAVLGGTFAFYIWFAASSFWYINSGFYAIVNEVLSTARSYLAIANGTDYALRVDNVYAAVTALTVFVGILSCLVLAINMQRGLPFFGLILLTGLPLLIPLYFEQAPGVGYLLLLLIAWVTAAAVRAGGTKRDPARALKALFPRLAVFTLAVALCGLGTGLARGQALSGGRTPGKSATEAPVSGLVEYGLAAVFGRDGAGGGVSGGLLGRGDSVQPDYETDLIVRYTPYSDSRVYLKAFTGKDYEGDRWTPAGVDGAGSDGGLAVETEARKSAYESSPESQGRGLFEVMNVGANPAYQYRPYFTDDSASAWNTGVSADTEAVPAEISGDGEEGSEASASAEGETAVYTYYPAAGETPVPTEEIDPAYLNVPESCAEAVEEVCAREDFSGSPEEIADEVVSFFARDYGYTLRPGYNFFGKDYISYFLLDSKKGYCAHFASAAVMLFRQLGIPARYVEGYAFSYNDLLADGSLEEDASYDDWYKGYAPMGRTGLIRLEVSDARAHGWVEIYIEGRGWTLVDPTPAARAEETGSFWEDFLSGSGERGGADAGTIGQQALRAIRGISLGAVFVFLGLAAAFLLWYLVRAVRESRLPAREQIVIRYRRWIRRMSRRHTDFAALRTIEEQLSYAQEKAEGGRLYGLRRRHGESMQISEAAVQEIYSAFFGPEGQGGYEEALVLVRKL